ncbi:MAG: histidine kinase [Treponema sp.]|nr:histidine kinase [Treponema sp.]
MLERLRNFLQKKSLVYQLTAVITTLMTVILILVISITSVRTSRDLQNKIYASTQMLLELQIKNAAAYFSQMNAFSLNPRNDVRFLKIISTDSQYDYSTKAYIMSVVRNAYYQRDDLVDYSIYVVNLNKGYFISRENRNVSERPLSDITSDPLFPDFSRPRYYRAVIPSGQEGNLLVYYRTLINIENGRPLAFVRFTVDTSWFDKTLRSGRQGELTVLRNRNGSMYYRDSVEDYDVVSLEKQGCLTVSAESEDEAWNLTTYISKKQLDLYLSETRTLTFTVGILFIVLSVVLLVFFIRILVHPLSVLAGMLRNTGQGNFKSLISISGCSEVTSLCTEYNTMIHRIDELIQKNYVAELNWKNAQLAALESQINPHFLYNTLQTISAEAIENDQMKINDMVMALSSMLKYTIRGPETVTLRNELEHVKDYLFLQKARFENRLTYEFVIAGGTEEQPVPKISVTTLVENSIIHGMSKTADSVRIEITAEHTGGKLIITVTDDGAGIPAARLAEIQKILVQTDPRGQITGENNRDTECIGLRNLSNRLQLLYGKTARLCIYSTEHTGTSTVMEVNDV